MYYFNARWYDAQTGRFISEDPIRAGANWNIYVNNNPMNFIDPTGLDPRKNGNADYNTPDFDRNYDNDDDDDKGSDPPKKEKDESDKNWFQRGVEKWKAANDATDLKKVKWALKKLLNSTDDPMAQDLLNGVLDNLEEIITGDVFVFGEADFVLDNKGSTVAIGGFYDLENGLVDSGLFTSRANLYEVGGAAVGLSWGAGLISEISGETVVYDLDLEVASISIFMDSDMSNVIGAAYTRGPGLGRAITRETTMSFTFRHLYNTYKQLEYEMIYKQYENLY